MNDYREVLNSRGIKDELSKTENETEGTKVVYGNHAACSQIAVSLVQNFLLFSVGMSFGMPTVVLGVLSNRVASNETIAASPHLILSDEQGSWLGSILFLFHPVGAIISGYALELLGRKKLMIAVCFPFLIGWTLIYYVNSVFMIFLGTFAMGLGIGCCEAPIISYIGEICEPRMRGALTLLTAASANVGILILFFINALTDWRMTALLSAFFPLIAMVMLLFIPESPTWLASKGRLVEAEQALRWVRGWSKKDKVLVEFDQLVRDVHKAANSMVGHNSDGSERKSTLSDKLNYLRRPEIIRPFNMLFVLFFTTVIGSFIPMRPFLVEIFHTLHAPIEPEWVLVLTGVLGITGSIVSALTVNMFGKRGMALWSTAICFVFTFLLGICAMNLHWNGWIALTVFCICFWVSGYGVLVLPWMLMSEIFPMQIRGIACGMSAALSSIIGFVVTKTYLNTTAWFGLHGTLFLYTIINAIGWFYIYFYVPETEDRTLQEIVDFFAENKSARKFKRPKKPKQVSNY